MTTFSLNYLSKDSYLQTQSFLRYWGLGLQHMNFEGTHWAHKSRISKFLEEILLYLIMECWPIGGVMFYGICTLSPSNITWIQNFKTQFATRVSEKGFWTFVAKISTEARFPLLATVLGYKMRGWSHRSSGSSQPLSFHWIYDNEKG